MVKNLSVDERFELIKRNTVEIITEEDLRELLKKNKKPVVYCGYEPSGPLHLGHLTLTHGDIEAKGDSPVPVGSYDFTPGSSTGRSFSGTGTTPHLWQ